MEVLAAASGVAGLLSLTIETAKILNHFTIRVQNAKREINEVYHEVIQLQSTLGRLAQFLRSDEAKDHAFDYTRVLCTSTGNCQDELENLRRKIEVEANHRFARWKWPFNSSESHRAVQTLRAYTSTFHFALSIDTTFFIGKKTADITQVLADEFQRCKVQIDEIHHLTEDTRNMTKDIVTNQEMARALDWISTFDFKRKHEENSRLRLDGTGTWTLENSTFEEWARGVRPLGKVLWCYGAPGAGKSIIASLIIDTFLDHASNDGVVVAYHYFSYQEQDKETCLIVIRSLLRQLLKNAERLPASLQQIYAEMNSKGKELRLEDAKIALMDVAETFTEVVIILDALDEAVEAERSILMAVVQSLPKCCKVIVTSRPHLQDISKALQNGMSIEIKARNSDIRQFLRTRMSSMSDHLSARTHLSDVILDTITNIANGIFLLAVLHLENVLREPTIGDAFQALSLVSSNLQQTFEGMLSRVSTQQSQSRSALAKGTLSVLTYARRPIFSDELCDVLTIREDSTHMDRLFRPSIAMILECCGGLVVFDRKTDVVHLVHLSLHQYLHDDRAGHKFAPPHILGRLCLVYLSLDDFSSGACLDGTDITKRRKAYPFLRYAASWWGYHVDDHEDLRSATLKLLHSLPHRANAVQIHFHTCHYRPAFWVEAEANSHSPLIFAAMYSMHNAARILLEDESNQVDAATARGTTALIRAASNNDLALVKLLTARGADLHRSNAYGTILHCAAEAGASEAMRYLLQLGLNVDIQDRFGRTPLHCALFEGHLSTVKLLLQFGANVDATVPRRGTALWFAFECLDTEVIDYLLRYLIKANAKLSMVAQRLYPQWQRVQAQNFPDNAEKLRLYTAVSKLSQQDLMAYLENLEGG